MRDAPYMYWVGMNTAPDLTPEETERFTNFYTNTHIREVVSSNPGFFRATRYELAEQDPRGDFGPRWLVSYEMNDEAAAAGYIARNDGPPEGRPTYTPGLNIGRSTPGTGWRLIWRRHAPQEGSLTEAPYIYLVGMNVQPDTTPEGLKEFDTFYTNTHVPEVVAGSNFQRGTRYELHRQFAHPGAGSPRFMALYDADEAAITGRAERRANPQPGGGSRLSSGPPTWESHDTLWRLTYKRIACHETP